MADQYSIARTPAEREEFFTALYKNTFPVVAKYVSRMGGTFDEAKDIFQETLVAYYEKMAAGRLVMYTSEQAYLLGIAKHLWAAKFRTDVKLKPIDDFETEFADEKPTGHAGEKLLRYLESAGQKCMELLKAFYYDHLNASEIAKQFGYLGERSATVQKYKCMEKIRETVKQRSLTYEDFIE